ncbi:MAG: methyltransferase [Deltaproteobacteria bacterium]
MAVSDSLSAVPVTHDTLFAGVVRFTQPADGYRAPVDGLLLAAFAGGAIRLAVDLGAGAGMVSLAMLHRTQTPHIIAVESDPALSACLVKNLADNDLTERGTALEIDVLAAARSRRGSADLVVANPPFYRDATHTPARHERAHAARAGKHDRDPLVDFVGAARALLGRGGRACFVWPANDLERFLARASSAGLAARRLRAFHPTPDAPARRVLLECRPGHPGGLTIEPPLIQFDRDGRESRAYRDATRGDATRS